MNHVLNAVETHTLLHGHTYRIFSLHVVSLDISISHDLPLHSVKFFLNKSHYPESIIIHITRFVFARNWYFNQISGVAMGIKMGHNYAYLFMCYFEHKGLEPYRGHFPAFYRLYIDGTITVTSIPE